MKEFFEIIKQENENKNRIIKELGEKNNTNIKDKV